jgi:hypothetical protein
MKKGRITESVKIDTETVKKVREYTNTSEQTIGGFFSLAAIEKLTNQNKKQKK